MDLPKRLRKKVTKRVNFLENVAKSHKLSAQSGVRKKRRRSVLDMKGMQEDSIGIANMYCTSKKLK